MEGVLTVTADGAATTGTAAAEPAAAEGESHDGADMSGTASPAAMQAEMEKLMQESIGAFPAETEGEGAAVLEPTIMDDGTKLFELTVSEIEWEVEPGKVVDAIAYNGAVPGPTLKADVGDEVIIRVTNELEHAGTSLHPHGFKNYDFKMDGVTYVSQDPIGTGESMDYRFTMGEESVGTYHSHHMSLEQVPNGLFGAMVVGDWAEISGFDNVVAEEVMILNDAGNIGFSLNGKSFPATKAYQYQQGDRVVVHYANEGQMSHPMHLHNQQGTVIAKDGYPLPEGARYSGDTFNVAPGERLTVVYELDNVGTWVWHCHILSHVKRSDGSMFGMLTAVIVTERESA
jgi:FtsP/CotA-like multicopper oxidase with cupredoxin domain